MPTTNEEAIAVQRRIVEAIRAVDEVHAINMRGALLRELGHQGRFESGLPGGLDPFRAAVVLAALVRSPALWDACAQLRQIHVLEERAVHEKHLRPTNPNPETDR